MSLLIHARRRVSLAVAAFATLLPLLAATPALAHAHLRAARPSDGGTVPPGLHDLRLSYSEAVEPRFSSVSIAGPDGKPLAAAPVAGDPADGRVLVLHLDRPLTPGAYTVTWHATSVDTHRTEGSYRFTVAP